MRSPAAAILAAACLAAAADGALRVETFGDRAKLEWDAVPGAAQYEATVWTTNFLPQAGETVREYGFDALSNPGGSWIGRATVTDRVASAYPGLAGSSVLQLPPRSEGIVQLSTPDERGVLSCDAGGDFDNLSMVAVLRRYFNESAANHDDAAWMSVGWEEPEGTTNILALVALEDGWARAVVPLDGIPAGKKVLLNAPGGDNENKKYRRVQIDRIDFIRGWAPARVETNVVARVRLPAGRNRLCAGALECGAEHFFSVAPVAADGTAGEAETVAASAGPRRPFPFAAVLR